MSTPIVSQYDSLPLVEVNWKQRSETKWLHPFTQRWLTELGYRNIEHEVTLKRGRVDFTATNPDGIFCVIEAKRSLKNERATATQIKDYARQFTPTAKAIVAWPADLSESFLIPYYSRRNIEVYAMPYASTWLAREMARQDLSLAIKGIISAYELLGGTENQLRSSLRYALISWSGKMTDQKQAEAYLKIYHEPLCRIAFREWYD